LRPTEKKYLETGEKGRKRWKKSGTKRPKNVGGPERIVGGFGANRI